MTVKEAILKEVGILREKHISISREQRERRDSMYGVATQNTYERMIDSYLRIVKDLDNDR